MSIEHRQRGLTLIELIVFVVIVSVALAGVLSVLNVTARTSADPLVRKQMLAIAEALLEEVQMQPFTICDPDDATAATGVCTLVTEALGREINPDGIPEARLSVVGPYDNVNDYVNADGSAINGNGFGLGDATNAIKNIAGSAAAPLGYTASISVRGDALNGIAAAHSLLVTVTVGHKSGDSLVLQGYRTRHSPRFLP